MHTMCKIVAAIAILTLVGTVVAVYVTIANAQDKKLPAVSVVAEQDVPEETICLLDNSKIQLHSDFVMNYTVFGDPGKPDLQYGERTVLQIDCNRVGSTWICRGVKINVKDKPGIGYMDTVVFDAKQVKVMVATDVLAIISISTRLTVVMHQDTSDFSVTDIHDKYSGRSEVRCNRVAGKTRVSSTESATK